MKCNMLIKTATKGKQTAIVTQGRETALDRKWTLSRNWRRCKGEVKASIDVYDKNTYMYDDPDLTMEIEYICQKCRTRHNLKDLMPVDIDSLYKWLNDKLEIYEL